MKILKWTFIVLAVLAIVIFSYVYYLISGSEKRLEKKYELSVPTFPIPADSASLERGKHLVSALCLECHGYNLGGKELINDPQLAVVYSPNLTSGKGGVVSGYTDTDWIRAIRHGAGPDSVALFVMPSTDFNYMCENDIAAVIAYLKSVPPVDAEFPAPTFGTLGKVLLGLGAFGDILNVETLDHSKGPVACQNFSSSVDFGNYMVNISGCRTCHGPELNGMQGPEPGAPFSPNLTPGGNLANWTNEDFVRSMRSGITKEGKELNNKYMPWKGFAHYDDNELEAMYAYFKSLSPLETPAK